ncbi:MAG: B12-binding domain-containing radical SAM protein [Candidatus Omnitrophica bacterium]|nr:B12-binding domain-containing radical SAM protein [Candidatus Omnitrophota bacterium]
MPDFQLISPPMIAYKGDIFGTIPSPPIGVASIAAYLRQKGFTVNLLDCFGESPSTIESYKNDFLKVGLLNQQILERIDPHAYLIGISVHSGMTASFCLELAHQIKKQWRKPIVVGGPHVSVCYKDFLLKGIDFAVIGEGEKPIFDLLCAMLTKSSYKNISGIVCADTIEQLITTNTVPIDELPFPAWDLVPLEKYWSLNMTHSPVQGRFAPMITSRGCPFNCAFCSTPLISRRRWRGCSPERVIAEIEYLKTNYGVEDIFIQDDNFNADPKRVLNICALIEKRSFKIRFTLPSGVRLENIDDEVIYALARAGFTYLCLAPESGSSRIRHRLNKHLDEERLYAVQRLCRKNKIRTGAFIIIGTPQEKAYDILMTARLIAKLLFRGLDDVSIFIFSPIPGSKLEKLPSIQMPKDYLGICWTPRWRSDFKFLVWIRKILYLEYIILKIIIQPCSIIRHLLNISRNRFETKGEMGMRRLFDVWMGKWKVKTP